MRKILSFAMLAMLLVAGCAKDVDSLNGGDTVAVTFSAKLPVEVSRTVGDGSQATVLKYAIYSTEGVLFDGYNYQDLTVQGNVATLTLDLVKGQSYKIVFWAQNAAAPYTFDRVAKTVTINYDDKELSNDEVYDAFYVMEPVTVKGPFQKQVTLRRPFAQINLGATKADVAAAKALGVEIDKSQVAFTDVPTVLNLVDGTLGEKTTNVNVTFNYNSLPGNDLTVNEEDYAYIAANYILADANTNVTNVTFAIKQGDKVINQDVTVPAVSYKRNYRTNILGRLLTSAVDFNIVIDGTPEGDIALGKETELYLAMQTEGEYTLSEDMTLSKPFVVEEGVNFTLNLNGKTMKTAVEQGKLIEVSEGATVTIKNGKLEVISTNGAVDGTGVSTGGSSAVYSVGGNVIMENVEIIGSKRGGHRAVQIFDGVGDFTNVKIDVDYGTGFNAGSGATVTLKDCDVTVNGMYSAPYNSVCFSVMGGGKLVVESGNYKVINNDTYVTGKSHGGWGGIIMNSGGTMDINGGTFTNVPADLAALTNERSLFSIDATAGLSATLNLNGGTFVPQRNKMVEKGGSGSNDVFAYVDGNLIPGFYVNDGVLAAMHDMGDGRWMVIHDLANVDAVAKNSAELESALANGDTTIVLVAGEYVLPSNFAEGVTLKCDEGVVFTAATPQNMLNINGATVVGATFKGSNESGANLAKGTVNGTFKDCTFEGYNTLRYCYAGTDEVVFEGCTFKGYEYAVHFDSGTNKTLKFKDCKFYGTFTNGVGFAVEVDNCEFHKDLRGMFNIPNFYDKSTVVNSDFVFDGTATVEVVRLWNANEDATKHIFTDCTVNGAPLKDNTSYLLQKLGEGDKLTIDGEVYVYEGGVLDTQSWYQDAQGVYHIIKGKGLANMSANYFAQGGKFVLDNNIDMAGIAFAPFCQATLGQGFLEFDGNGKKISNLAVTSDYAALFGQLFNFYIHDLTIEASTTSGTYAAAILGYTDNTGDGSYTKKIERCNVVDCTVGSGKYVGGVVGYSSSNTAEIANCIVSESDIVSKYSEDGGATYKGHCGGIIGGCYGGSVASCSVVDNTFDVLGDRTGLVVGSAWGGTFSATTVNGNTGLDRNCGLTVANGTWN